MNVEQKRRLVEMCDAGKTVAEAQTAITAEFGATPFTDDQVRMGFVWVTNFRRTGGAFGTPDPGYRKGAVL